MSDVDFYRVQSRLDVDKGRYVADRWWYRTYQADLDPCIWAARAWTKRGIVRKARRWSGHSIERRLRAARRRSWIRRNITQRSDSYYAEQRMSGRRDYRTETSDGGGSR